MPNQQQHKARAERFLELYYQTEDDQTELKLVALFYCVVHIVEMVAAKNGVDPKNHKERGAFLKKHHKGMWKHYHPLSQRAWEARYSGNPRVLTAKEIEEELRGKRVKAFERWAENELGELDGKLIVARPEPVSPA